MWNLLRCYLSGRHDYGVGCEPGAIFLRCVHCGRRSSGWTVDARAGSAGGDRSAPVPVPVHAGHAVPRAVAPHLHVISAARASGRVIPFQRTAAH